MNRFIRPSDWRPVGIDDLEDSADEALRSAGNASVIAGPGAGKTELLAQRACFLLQTGGCAPPFSILAISYKRDSARNLQRRVEQRCGPVLARRFRSMTFDAFAKGLVDRFLPAIPPAWRPSRGYAIENLTEQACREFLRSLSPPGRMRTPNAIHEVKEQDFLREHFYGSTLEPAPIESSEPLEWAALQLWEYRIRRLRPSRLTFPMFGRLAELVLRTNPRILKALRSAYSHVFLDEFQDTTHIQYDLLKTAFLGSSASVTAVGDNKQRIMGFAMAMRNAFGPFEAEFAATRYRLTRNYRSVSELVRVQRVLAKAIDPQAAAAEAAGRDANEVGQCFIWTFPDPNVEARFLASYIKHLIRKEGAGPRDISVLVKQRADLYSEGLIQKLESFGIRARVEAELQELLAEPLTETILDFLRLAVQVRNATSWGRLVEILAATRPGEEDERRMQLIDHDLAVFKRTCRDQLLGTETPDQFEELLRSVVSFIGDAYRVVFPQYGQGDLLGRVLEGCVKGLWSGFERTKSWPGAIEQFEGGDCVPIMTIHKSKGLEYHSVIFVGLEDSAFWSFRNQTEEDRNAFFVAYSRAKRNVVFTFSATRQSNPRRPIESQSRSQIGELYQLLLKAGIRERHIAEWPLPKSP